uniref:Uncharacterized protein n=1 Tax=Arundo donax TaxID=35708 RepID=A0A0A9HR18_ARUDO
MESPNRATRNARTTNCTGAPSRPHQALQVHQGLRSAGTGQR